MSRVDASSMTTENRSSQADIEALKADLAALRNDLRSFVTHAGGVARSRAADVKEKVAEVAGEVGERGRAARDEVQTKIEDHPFMSVAIALGAGVLIGALIARRSE